MGNESKVFFHVRNFRSPGNGKADRVPRFRWLCEAWDVQVYGNCVNEMVGPTASRPMRVTVP